MARIVFKVEPTSKTRSQLSKGVRHEGSKVWAGRAMVNAAPISKGIGNMLVGKFNNSDVSKALRGGGGEDLPAHLGLDDHTANSLADGMAELIRNSVRIMTRSAGGVSVLIQAVDNNWNDYLSLPGASYLSHPSEITIPVVRWLLIDPTIDVGAAAYSIVFEGEGGQFNTRIQKISRSGRAIMVALKSLGGGTPYVLPSIISGGMGENFIQYTLGQKNVSMEAAHILMKKVK